MYKIFTAIKAWLAGWLEPSFPADPVSRMSPAELADLPVHHPPCDPCEA